MNLVAIVAIEAKERPGGFVADWQERWGIRCYACQRRMCMGWNAKCLADIARGLVEDVAGEWQGAEPCLWYLPCKTQSDSGRWK